MILNIVRPCRTNLKLSAYAALKGEYSYNHIPIAPLGAQIIVHDNPTVRPSWSPHAHHAWLIGPAPDHYRCFTVFNPKTKSTTIANQFHWAKSNRFTFPRITPEEQVTKAALDLTKAIKQYPIALLLDNGLKSKIDKLCTIFQEATDKITSNKPTPIEEESPETLKKYIMPPVPRVNKEENTLKQTNHNRETS